MNEIMTLVLSLKHGNLVMVSSRSGETKVFIYLRKQNMPETC